MKWIFGTQSQTNNGTLKKNWILILIQNVHLYDVARYDTAHGTPRRDIMSRSNSILEKDWLTQMEFDSALTYAINDFKENYANCINA
jgi:hypothetical protein